MLGVVSQFGVLYTDSRQIRTFILFENTMYNFWETYQNLPLLFLRMALWVRYMRRTYCPNAWKLYLKKMYLEILWLTVCTVLVSSRNIAWNVLKKDLTKSSEKRNTKIAQNNPFLRQRRTKSRYGYCPLFSTERIIRKQWLFLEL